MFFKNVVCWCAHIWSSQVTAILRTNTSSLTVKCHLLWTHCPRVRHICNYASLNWVSTGSGNGLAPVWCQVIILTNADLLSTGPCLCKFQSNLNQNKKAFIEKKIFENAVCKIATILSQSQCVIHSAVVLVDLKLSAAGHGWFHMPQAKFVYVHFLSGWPGQTVTDNSRHFRQHSFHFGLNSLHVVPNSF